MTGKQHAVLWLGLLLIMARLFTTHQWHEIWGVIGNGTNLGGFGGGFSITGAITGAAAKIATPIGNLGNPTLKKVQAVGASRGGNVIPGLPGYGIGFP